MQPILQIRAVLHARGALAKSLVIRPAWPLRCSPRPHPAASECDAGQGGGYEWRADGQPVAAGAAALELSQDGKITKFTVVWDGSLLDDQAITALTAAAADR